MPDWCPTCVNLEKPWEDPVCKECLQQSLPFGKKSPTKYEERKKTNYGRVIHMSPKELALFIHNVEAQAAWTKSADSVDDWLVWLKQEVEDNV